MLDYGSQKHFIIGCDSRTIGGENYATYDKEGYGIVALERNYDAYLESF